MNVLVLALGLEMLALALGNYSTHWRKIEQPCKWSEMAHNRWSDEYGVDLLDFADSLEEQLHVLRESVTVLMWPGGWLSEPHLPALCEFVAKQLEYGTRIRFAGKLEPSDVRHNGTQLTYSAYPWIASKEDSYFGPVVWAECTAIHLWEQPTPMQPWLWSEDGTDADNSSDPNTRKWTRQWLSPATFVMARDMEQVRFQTLLPAATIEPSLFWVPDDASPSPIHSVSCQAVAPFLPFSVPR